MDLPDSLILVGIKAQLLRNLRYFETRAFLSRLSMVRSSPRLGLWVRRKELNAGRVLRLRKSSSGSREDAGGLFEVEEHVKWPTIPQSKTSPPCFAKPRWTSAFAQTSEQAIYFPWSSPKGMKRVALSTSLLPRRRIPIRIPSIAFLTVQQPYPLANRRSFISAAMADHPTLVKPPPIDPSKSSIENVLELTELSAIAPDLYTNTRPLWHPPGARGIYGGAVIAQCLSAAQRTVPSNFTVHSMHCYFVLAGDAEIPVMYYVEHVREGKSFATRTVQARQRGKCIFTTTMSFVREKSGGKKTINHAVPLPEGLDKPNAPNGEEEGGSPFISHRIEILNKDSKNPHEKRTRQWIKARGRISEAGGHEAHLSALAYMSDSYFIGTISRIHDLWRFGAPSSNKTEGKDSTLNDDMAQREAYVKKLKEFEGFGHDLNNEAGRPEIGMMVSLDHTIYFHEPRAFRADEWMFTEMFSPWSGDGRGVVTQHMFAADGTLVATCFQEGVVRLKEERAPKASKL